MATVILKERRIDLQRIPGSGAAGGLGGAFAAFLDGTFASGAGLVLDANGVRKKEASFSLMFSGEGKIDSQTLKGKLPMAIASTGSAQDVPVILIGGCRHPCGRTDEQRKHLGTFDCHRTDES